jgi:hypothetical protein
LSSSKHGLESHSRVNPVRSSFEHTQRTSNPLASFWLQMTRLAKPKRLYSCASFLASPL